MSAPTLDEFAFVNDDNLVYYDGPLRGFATRDGKRYVFEQFQMLGGFVVHFTFVEVGDEATDAKAELEKARRTRPARWLSLLCDERVAGERLERALWIEDDRVPLPLRCTTT